MKHSFRRQLTGIFTAVMAGTLFLIFFGGIIFLERYYIHDKKNQVMEAYEKMNTAAREDALYSDEFYESLQSFSTTDNISLIVMGTDLRINIYSTRDKE